MADSDSTGHSEATPANQDDAGTIPAFAEEARLAFELFKKQHTLENRTLKEMFYHGYYAAKFFTSPKFYASVATHRWRFRHRRSGQRLETIDINTAANLVKDIEWEQEP